LASLPGPLYQKDNILSNKYKDFRIIEWYTIHKLAYQPKKTKEGSQLDIRYSANQRDFKRYTTEETRREFLIESLFVPDQVTAVYSHVDRMVTLGVMPVSQKVPVDKGIDVWKRFGTNFFWSAGKWGFSTGAKGAVT
jgi:hypothetical protein